MARVDRMARDARLQLVVAVGLIIIASAVLMAVYFVLG